MAKELSVKLKIDAEGNVSGVVRDINNDLKNMDGQVGKVADSTDRLTGALKHVGHYGLAAFAGWGVSNVVSDVIQATQQMQSLQASLVTVKGSALEADKAFAQIQEFATTTPYQLAEVTDAFIKMEALGLSASQRAMRSYGDTASSMGKSLNQMVEAVADAATGEFERLKEFGIKASSEGDRVKFTFRGVTTEVGKNAAEIEDYLIKLGEINFTGGMARQMETLGGQLSNLDDSWQKALNAIGTASQPAITAAIDGMNYLANGVETAADYIDEAAYLAGIGLTTALTVKAIPAVWAASTAFSAATASAGGFAAATRAATAAAMAFAATPVGLAVTAMAGGVAYLALRQDETEVATRDLTEALKAQNIELSKSEIKLKAAELAEYRQQLRALIELKNQNGAVDVLGFKQAGLEEKIARLEQGKSALVTVQEMLNEQEREFIEISDEASGAYNELERNAAAYAEAISFIAQTENEWRNESAKERASIQDKINALTLTEAQHRQLIIDKIQPENRALMEKLFLMQDQAKAQKEAESVTEGMIAAVERENAAIYAKSDAYLASQEALLAYKQAMQADGEAFSASIDNIALSVESIGDAWTRTGDKASEAIASMVKTWMDFEKQQVKAAKDHDKIDAARFDNLDKYYQGIITLGDYKKNEAKLDKKQAELEEQNIDNQIALYYGLAGAMSGAFKEGSEEAEAFRAIQQSIALFDGIRAVINAWAAPFPTNLAMVPLTTLNVAALLGQMGLSFSGGSAPGLSISSVAAPDGSRLGSDEASTSVANAYDRMLDLEADQYNELRGIYREIQELNNNLTGVVSSLYATGDLSNLSQGLMSSYKLSFGQGLPDFLRSDPTTRIMESLPLIGGVFGALNDFGGNLFNAISSGLFGSTKKSTSDYGLYLPAFALGGDLDLKSYQTIKTKKDGGWFGSSKTYYNDYYSQISGQSEDLMNRVFDSLRNGMIEMGEIVGRDVQSQVDSFAISLGKISTSGKSGEEIQKALTEAISTQSDKLAYQLFDDLVMMYGKLNESAFDTVSRLGIEKAIAGDILSMTNQTFAADAIAVSQALVNIADGIDSLKSDADSYFDAFFSDAEKQQRLYEQLTGAMDSVNLALPDTRDGYRGLVESLNLANAADQERYVTLMDLADAADQYYDNLEQNARESGGAIGELSNNLSAATVSMEQMADAARNFGNSLVQSAVNTVNAQASAISSIEGLISSLELEIGQAEQADAQLAENLRVEAINAEIANFNAGIEQQILALEEQKAAQEQAYLAEIERIELEKTNNDAQLESLENLTGVIQEQLNELTKLRDSVTSAREAFEDEGLSADQSYKLGQSMLRDIITSGDAANLDRALGLASSISTDSFATALDYKLARAESASLMRTLEEQLGEQIDPLEAQLSELEQQSNALEMANDALNDIESAITGVSEQYDFQIAALRAQLKESVQANTLFDQSLSAQKAASKDALALMSSQLDVLKDIDESLASGQGLTSSILESLYDQYDLIDRNADAQVTFDEFKLMFAGVSDKDTLQKLFLITDRNGDGIISKLDALNAQAYQQKDLWIAELLPIIDAISNQQLTQDQMVFALQGLASEEQAIALFNALDTDNNGILTKLEAQNGILLDLSPRLASVISNGFAGFDANLSGGLTFDELELGLSGIATDAQLRAIFAELDSNGNQTISALEALGRVFAEALTQNFASLDTSLDGLLTASELKAYLGDSVSNSTVEAALADLDINNDSRISEVEAKNRELALEIQRIYAEMLNRTDVDTQGQQYWSEAVKELNLTIAELEQQIALAAVGTQQTQLIQDWVIAAYATLGRSGFGTAANQIDLSGYNFWSNAIAAGTYSDQADFMNDFLAAAGYQAGGFTANIATDKIAGVVHGGEYVAPSSQLEKYPELFAALEADRKGHLDLEIPAYAAGGVHSGGLRLVGERGPELEFTGPSRIYSNNDTLKMLDNSRLEFLVEKLIRRIEDLEEQAARTAVATQDSADLLNRFSRGLPTYNIEVQ